MHLMPHPILKEGDCNATSSNLPGLQIVTPDVLPFARCSRAVLLSSPHVHFPPTPSLTSTHITHSANIYDRAPIVVSENTCAIPERDHDISSMRDIKGSYFHPRASEVCEKEPILDLDGGTSLDYDSLILTTLPELSFSSESASSDSDIDCFDAYGFNSPPEPASYVPDRLSNASYLAHIPMHAKLNSELCRNDPLSFLPHPSSNSGCGYLKPHIPIPPSRPKYKRRATPHCRAASTFSEISMDDGCLGGF